MYHLLKLWGLTLLCLITAQLQAQKEETTTIKLQNPSFESLPRPGSKEEMFSLPGWSDCGPKTESPPDIQPGFFDCKVLAQHGSSYLGLVVRDVETWESVGQRLTKPLQKDQCYEMSIYVCRAETYMSFTVSDQNNKVNYATPARLLVWAGNGYCDKAELLYQTGEITNTRWLKTELRFHPKNGSYTHIILEAYYKSPTPFPYNGNLLLDNCSDITEVACNPDKMPDPPAKKEKEVVAKGPVKKDNTPKATPAKQDTPKVTETPKKPVTTEPIGKNVKTGKIYRLEKVYFDADKYDIKPEGETELAELYNFLSQNANVSIEVGGHTNNKLYPDEAKALTLSTNRAKAVAEWLTSRGIATDRVSYKGYGWTQPVMPNTSEEGKKRNQRVEVKVLKN
jgi:outer membrane protein OmpA-like peptidoglycan-associated protein